MIRFTHEGQQTDRDVPAHAHAIGPTAIEIAGVAAQTTATIRRTSETTWVVTVTAEGETVTAEVIDASNKQITS